MSEDGHVSGLPALEASLRRDLELLCYPPAGWVVPRAGPGGSALADVVIVGGGMCGLAAGFALLREGVSNLRILDRAPRGREGPWVTYARMETLRSPKHLTGPAQGLPALTFRAWYEAQWGEVAWEALGRIPRPMWMDYLRWYRRVLDLPVENGVAVEAIEPAGHGFTLRLSGPAGPGEVHARKVVLATGREGIARPRVPAPLEPFRGARCRHTSEAIDFGAMRGRRVAVVGLSASAMDNAAEALEAGAGEVHLLARAPAVPRINKAKGTVYAGFTHGFPRLSDAERFRLLGYIFACRIAPPRDSVLRVTRHANAHLHLDAPVLAAAEEGPALRLDTGAGTLKVEHLILGTGFSIDLDGAAEIAGFAGAIARWRDRFEPPADQRGSEFLQFPYLGPGFEFLERTPGEAPFLRDLYCFSFAAALSHGNVSGDIPAVSEGAERLARAIAGDLFTGDVGRYREALEAYDEPELLGDEFDTARWWPATGGAGARGGSKEG
jgi:cation diffusion facilitator CzcD-associated flavoprotein CzcO